MAYTSRRVVFLCGGAAQDTSEIARLAEDMLQNAWFLWAKRNPLAAFKSALDQPGIANKPPFWISAKFGSFPTIASGWQGLHQRGAQVPPFAAKSLNVLKKK
jgi:hypothetical protein